MAPARPLTSAAVLHHLSQVVPQACVVSSCGFPTRELHQVGESPGNLYLVGSMGMAAPIAFGIAAARPGQLVVAVDGDGSMAMNPGALGLADLVDDASLLHVVLDNGVHESTGGQRTVLPDRIDDIALAFGYRRAVTVRTVEELRSIDATAVAQAHPLFVRALVAPRGGAPGGRVHMSPRDVITRTQNFLGVGQPTRDPVDVRSR